MNIVHKTFRWMFEKATGFPAWRGPRTWDTGNWPSGVFGGESDAGVSVTAETALHLSAIWACVRIRSLMFGHFPVVIYKKTPAGMETIDNHPLCPILQESANAYMTAMEWKQAVSVAFDLYGNAFSKIERIGDRVVALNPLQSGRMRIKWDKELIYEYTENSGSVVPYKPTDIFHLRNFSLDGIVGLNPIEQQRHVIGLGLAQQKFGSSIYRNGGRPAGTLEHPGNPTPEVKSALRESWERIHSGPDNANRVAILWDGMKYNSIGMSSEDMQFIEARQFQLGEYARMYGLPPHLIADLARSTNNNIEHQGIEVVTYTFGPETTLWEQRIKKSLLNRPGEDAGIYANIDTAALLVGDQKSLSEALASQKQNGFITTNEGRKKLGLNKSTQPGADDLTVQSNMIDLTQLSKLTAGGKPAPADGGQQ